MLQIFQGKVCNVAYLPGGKVCKGEGLQYNTGTIAHDMIYVPIVMRILWEIQPMTHVIREEIQKNSDLIT